MYCDGIYDDYFPMRDNDVDSIFIILIGCETATMMPFLAGVGDNDDLHV